MTWTDDLREELTRRQTARASDGPRRRGGQTDEAQAAGQLVRLMLDQLNRELLAGRGAVWEMQARWGDGLWELWWSGEATRTAGPHIVVAILRDSRGTPYVKVQQRRLAVADPALERRLQLALRAAFLQRI